MLEAMIMGKLVLCTLSVLGIIYLVPFVVYSLFTVLCNLKPPEGASAFRFLSSVFVIKVGTAVAFVWLLYLAREPLQGRWLLYAFIWWLAAVLGEAGQAIGPGYTWKEAIAGVISESIYFPLSAFLAVRWLAD